MISICYFYMNFSKEVDGKLRREDSLTMECNMNQSFAASANSHFPLFSSNECILFQDLNCFPFKWESFHCSHYSINYNPLSFLQRQFDKSQKRFAEIFFGSPEIKTIRQHPVLINGEYGYLGWPKRKPIKCLVEVIMNLFPWIHLRSPSIYTQPLF